MKFHSFTPQMLRWDPPLGWLINPWVMASFEKGILLLSTKCLNDSVTSITSKSMNGGYFGIGRERFWHLFLESQNWNWIIKWVKKFWHIWFFFQTILDWLRIKFDMKVSEVLHFENSLDYNTPLTLLDKKGRRELLTPSNFLAFLNEFKIWFKTKLYILWIEKGGENFWHIWISKLSSPNVELDANWNFLKDCLLGIHPITNFPVSRLVD